MERKPTYAELIAAGATPEEARLALAEATMRALSETTMPGRTKRLETFREVHTEQEERAQVEKARATHFLVASLKKALEDESEAVSMYETIAIEAIGAGHPEEGRELRQIADDESRHYKTLEKMMWRLSR